MTLNPLRNLKQNTQLMSLKRHKKLELFADKYSDIIAVGKAKYYSRSLYFNYVPFPLFNFAAERSAPTIT